MEKSYTYPSLPKWELLSYKDITPKEKQQIEKFISSFIIVNISDSIKDATIKVKTASLLKLPDSIIAATSIDSGIPLLTADKQFKTIAPLDLLLYER